MLSIVNRFLIAGLAVFLLSTSSAEDSAVKPAPEVFSAFISGWGDYADGYYADALISFYEAQAMDPRFEPGREGVQSCLRRMGLGEIANYADLYRAYENRRQPKKAPQSRNELAFWGVFAEEHSMVSNVSILEKALLEDLRRLSGVQVVPIQPLSKDSKARPSLVPARYNLMALIHSEAGQIRLALHLIENLDVEHAADIDLIVEAEDSGLNYRTNEIVLGGEGFVEYLQSKEGEALISDLLFGGVEPVAAEFQTREWFDQMVDQGECPEKDLPAFLSILSALPRSQKLLLEFDDWITWNQNQRGWLHGMALYLFQSDTSYAPEDVEFYTKLMGETNGNFTLNSWYKRQLDEIFLRHYPESLAAITLRINELLHYQLKPSTRELVAREVLVEVAKIERLLASGKVQLHKHSNRYPSSLSALGELMEYYAGDIDTLSFSPDLPLRMRFEYYDGGRALWLRMGAGPHRPTPNRNRDGDGDFDEVAAVIDAALLLESLPLVYSSEIKELEAHREWNYPWTGRVLRAPRASKLKPAELAQEREILGFIEEYLPDYPNSRMLNGLIQSEASGSAEIGEILLTSLEPEFFEDPFAAYEKYSSLLTSSLQFQNFHKHAIREEKSGDTSHLSTYRNNRENYANLCQAVIAGLKEQLHDEAYWERDFWRNESRLLRYFRVPWECVPSDYQDELLQLTGRASTISHPRSYEQRGELIEYLLDQADEEAVLGIRKLQARLTLQYVKEQPQRVWAYLTGVETAWILQDWELIYQFRELYQQALSAGELETNRTHRRGEDHRVWLNIRDSIAAYLDGMSALAYERSGKETVAVKLLEQKLLYPSIDMSTALHYFDPVAFPEGLKVSNTHEFLLKVQERIDEAL